MVFGKKRNLALVLSEGSAKGFAHIGILEVLEEHHVPVDAIIGTSMGALVGGLYAAGSLKDFKEDLLRFSKNKIAMMFIESRIKSGKATRGQIESFLKKFTKGKRIEKLDIPFTAVATDLYKGREVYLERGDLLKAILGSIAIPGIFQPVKFEKMLLADGGILNPLAEDYARGIADKVIEVNAMPKRFRYNSKGDVFDVISESIGIMSNELLRLKTRGDEKTLFIQLETEGISSFDFSKAGEIIEMGRRIGKKNLKRINEIVKI